jgi:hypothetical protein
MESVADLERVRWGDRTPSRKFFRFFPAKPNEKQVHTTSNAYQNVFFAYDRTSLPKS